MSDLSLLYQEVILDHCRHPRHFGELPNATHYAQGLNPFCGDEVSIALIIDNNKINSIQFTGKGCAICMASASLMCEQLQDKTPEEIHELFELFINQFQEKPQSESIDKLGKSQVFANVKHFPMRVKCATLPWHATKAALLKQKSITTEGDEL